MAISRNILYIINYFLLFKIALRKKIKPLKIGKFFVFVLLFAKKKEIEYNFIEKTRFTE